MPVDIIMANEAAKTDIEGVECIKVFWRGEAGMLAAMVGCRVVAGVGNTSYATESLCLALRK